MPSPEATASETNEVRIVKKTAHHLGEPIGETETHYDAQDRVVFERATDFTTGAVNTTDYVFQGGMREEIWKDKEGRMIRYVINENGERVLAERDPNFEDVDF